MMHVFICQEMYWIRKYATVLAFYVRMWQILMNNWPGSDLVFRLCLSTSTNSEMNISSIWFTVGFFYFRPRHWWWRVSASFSSVFQYSFAVVWRTTMLRNFRWFVSACEVWADETAEALSSCREVGLVTHHGVCADVACLCSFISSAATNGCLCKNRQKGNDNQRKRFSLCS